MDCLQCVRSKQWVGAVPLGLVMGGDPPPRPDGEEEESLTGQLTWAHRLQAQRAITGTAMMLVYMGSTDYIMLIFKILKQQEVNKLLVDLSRSVLLI